MLGRKAKTQAEKVHQISVFLSPEDHGSLEAFIAQNQLKKSAFMRDCLLRGLKLAEKELALAPYKQSLQDKLDEDMTVIVLKEMGVL